MPSIHDAIFAEGAAAELSANHGERDEHGTAANLTIAQENREDISAPFIWVERPKDRREPDDDGGLTRVETSIVKIETHHFAEDPRPFSHLALVTLPESDRKWSIDEDRGVEYGESFRTLHLKRDPLVRQTDPRRNA